MKYRTETILSLEKNFINLKEQSNIYENIFLNIVCEFFLFDLV
jgi:hypothetical protein